MADIDIVVPNPPWSSGGVGSQGTELEVQRKITHSFILTAPVVVVLVPRSRVKQPAGGVVLQAGTARPAQTMRLIEPSSVPAPVVTLDGVQRIVEFELLGEYDSTIGVYDTFELDGKHWEVVGLGFFNGWEQRALVSRIG